MRRAYVPLPIRSTRTVAKITYGVVGPTVVVVPSVSHNVLHNEKLQADHPENRPHQRVFVGKCLYPFGVHHHGSLTIILSHTSKPAKKIPATFIR